jgi:hypothetical protein
MENPKISSVSGDILGFYMVFHIWWEDVPFS